MRAHSLSSRPSAALAALVAVLAGCSSGPKEDAPPAPERGKARPDARVVSPTTGRLALARVGAERWVTRAARGGMAASFTREGAALRVPAHHGGPFGRMTQLAPPVEAAGDDVVGVSLRGSPITRLATCAVVAADCERRVTAEHEGGVIEWWENVDEGVEHGFTVPASAARAGLVELHLDVRGGLARDDAPGRLVVETASGGALVYDSLRVEDADGRTIPSEMHGRGEEIVLSADGRGARFPLRVDPIFKPTSNPATTFQVSANIASIASADVNGDGYADLVVGLPQAQVGGKTRGRVAVHLGSPAGLDKNAKMFLDGGVDGGAFGCQVAAAGDVTGDGLPDVLVGSCDYANGTAGQGAVFVFKGASGGLDPAPVFKLEGDQANLHMGTTVAGVGDVNKDGVVDFAIGTPAYSSGSGRVMIFYGSKGAISTTPAASFEPGQAGSRFGASVAGAGDVNKDGYADVIVGAPGWDDKLVDEGMAAIYVGGAGVLATDPTWKVFGNQRGASLGAAVAGLGDVDGDGLPEVAASAPKYASPTVVDAGAILVFPGAAGGPKTTASPAIVGAASSFGPGAQLGSALLAAGDLNGDGHPDLAAFGGYARSAFVYAGSCQGVVPETAVPVSASDLQHRYAIRPWLDMLGIAFAAGDFDKDGMVDLAFGGGTTIGTNFFWDPDLDGLDNQTEGSFESDPAKFDTDKDGCSDGTEGFYNDTAIKDPKQHGTCFDGDYGSTAEHACKDPTRPFVVPFGLKAGQCVGCGANAGKACSGFVALTPVGTSSACPDGKPVCVTSGPAAGSCTSACDGSYGKGSPNACKDALRPVCTGAVCVPCNGDNGTPATAACPDAASPVCATSGTNTGSCGPKTSASDPPPVGSSSTPPNPPDLSGCSACAIGHRGGGGEAAALLGCALALGAAAARRRRR